MLPKVRGSDEKYDREFLRHSLDSKGAVISPCFYPVNWFKLACTDLL